MTISFVSFKRSLRLKLFLILVSLGSALTTMTSAYGQHDGARDSVKQIALGNYDRVDSILAQKKPFAGEAESAFVKMLKAAAQRATVIGSERAAKAPVNGMRVLGLARGVGR